MYACTFLLRVTENMTPQNIDLSSWDNMYSNSFIYYYRVECSHIFLYFFGISNSESQVSLISALHVSVSLRHVSTDVPHIRLYMEYETVSWTSDSSLQGEVHVLYEPGNIIRCAGSLREGKSCASLNFPPVYNKYRKFAKDCLNADVH
jgi:hypothetical protein